jgi:hypothetical protein
LQSALKKVQAQMTDENISLEDNFAISASQRYSIMQKLLRKDEIPSQVNPTLRFLSALSLTVYHLSRKLRRR